MTKRGQVGRWTISRRPYTGYEDSFLAPGCRSVTTRYGYVILIVADGALHANLATGGEIYRGRRVASTKDVSQPVLWKTEAQSFVRACKRFADR